MTLVNFPAAPSPAEILRRPTLLTRGVSDAEIRTAVARRDVARLTAGSYIDADYYSGLKPSEQYAARVRAVAMRSPSLLVSHASAAVLQGLPLVGADASVVHLTRPGTGGARRSATRWVHAADLADTDRTELDGIALTAVARTVVDLARNTPVGGAVAAGDAALHRGLITFDNLQQVPTASGPSPRIAAARRAVQLLDSRAESPGESVLRVMLVGGGLAVVPQVEIFDDAGEFAGRPDLTLAEDGVLCEFDGKEKYLKYRKPGQSVIDAILAEKAREERLTELGWLVIRFIWRDLFDPARVLDRVKRACASRRRLVTAGAIRGSFRVRPA